LIRLMVETTNFFSWAEAPNEDTADSSCYSLQKLCQLWTCVTRIMAGGVMHPFTDPSSLSLSRRVERRQ
jgi:hypothetical protein